jgi:hypothetical protein
VPGTLYPIGEKFRSTSKLLVREHNEEARQSVSRMFGEVPD